MREHEDPTVEEVGAALRELPELAPPETVWREVQSRLQTQPRRATRSRTTRPVGLWPAAAAAVLLIGVMAGIRWGEAPTDVESLREIEAEDVAARIETLTRRSRALEREVASLPVVTVTEGPTLRALAGRIMAVDHRLSDGASATARSEQLWRTRVDLMESYAQLRREESDAVLLRVVC